MRTFSIDMRGRGLDAVKAEHLKTASALCRARLNIAFCACSCCLYWLDSAGDNCALVQAQPTDFCAVWHAWCRERGSRTAERDYSLPVSCSSPPWSPTLWRWRTERLLCWQRVLLQIGAAALLPVAMDASTLQVCQRRFRFSRLPFPLRSGGARSPFSAADCCFPWASPAFWKRSKATQSGPQAPPLSRYWSSLSFRIFAARRVAPGVCLIASTTLLLEPYCEHNAQGSLGVSACTICIMFAKKSERAVLSPGPFPALNSVCVYFFKAQNKLSFWSIPPSSSRHNYCGKRQCFCRACVTSEHCLSLQA